MADITEFENKVKGLRKAELKKRNMTYAHLVKKLETAGHKEDEHNLRNKIAQGKFTASFFVLCLSAIGCQSLRLED